MASVAGLVGVSRSGIAAPFWRLLHDGRGGKVLDLLVALAGEAGDGPRALAGVLAAAPAGDAGRALRLGKHGKQHLGKNGRAARPRRVTVIRLHPPRVGRRAGLLVAPRRVDR